MLISYPNYSPVVLFRSGDLDSEKELKVCEKEFVSVQSRMKITGGDLVIGRYSVLPFYKELEEDIQSRGAKMINSFKEYHYVADMKSWIEDLKELTPKTYYKLEDIPNTSGPLILKGETNSRKDKWNTHMFAKNKQEAIQTYLRLKDDSLFDNQEIYAREYIPDLITYFIDEISNIPIVKEFRFFFYKTNLLCGGFYWTNHIEELKKTQHDWEKELDSNCVPRNFLNKIASVLSQNTNFFVVDVAQRRNGDWVLIEVNDGQLSGLSDCNPEELYKNLKYHLWDKEIKRR